VGGIPDIVRHGKTGLLFPQKDPPAIAAAILELLKDPERAERLGRQGRELVETEFSWRHVVGQWEAFYAEASARVR
jgi:glycosyltransferase involved in cell wall biosynthesis